MTGQGEASCTHEGVSISVELRTVNNRFLKVVSRLGDSLASLEADIETTVRQHLRRGSVQLTVFARFPARTEDYRLNQVALQTYMEQALEVAKTLKQPVAINPGDFVDLPGVVEDASRGSTLSEELSQAVLDTVIAAIQNLNTMRRREGENMERQLLATLDQLKALADRILQRAPHVVSEYRTKLDARTRKVLAESQIEVPTLDLLREVQLFADRADICEELVRFESHIQQFRTAISDSESQGRKLDFLIQEFFRETNTIGSKANDAQISIAVVELKTLIEQMREIVQNIE